MIKAGSLLYSIILSLVISIICSFIILFSYLSSLEFDSHHIKSKLRTNLISGFNLFFSFDNDLLQNEYKSFDLYGDGKDSVRIIQSYWGAFETVSVIAKQGRFSQKRIGLIGAIADTVNSFCVYLQDRGMPIALAGNTILKGDAYISKANFRLADVNGDFYSKKKFVEGTVKQSSKNFFKIPKNILDQFDNLSNGVFNSDSIMKVKNMLQADSIINSFSNKTLVITTLGSLIIRDGFYSGNIIIYSPKDIIISSNCELEDVIVIAPRINIHSGFRGNLQCFASDSIIIEKDVVFKFPSCIGLIPTNKSIKYPGILFEENDSIFASIFALNSEFTKQVGLSIRENCFFYGDLLCQGIVDFKGKMYGSLIAEKVVYSNFSTVYENYIYNSEIDVSKRSKMYVGANLLKKRYRKGVAKWLN